MGNHRRKTLGVLVSGVSNGYEALLCKGVMSAAKEVRMNVVIIPGKYIDKNNDTNPELAYEYQYNTLFSYIKKSNIDGIIMVAGSIGAFTDESKMVDFLSKYIEIPILLVSSSYEGFRNIAYDNATGIREGMLYLIKELNCQKICMLGGPDGNTDVIERKETFLKVMAENEMEVGEYTYIPGLLSGDNHEACATMLDCNPDVDGIVCVNDYAALSLYDEMKLRGLEPGKDIHIFGYDNTLDGARANPPLATVGADPIVLGQKSVAAMLRIFAGEDFSVELLPTKLIVRASMGIEAAEFTLDGLNFLADSDANESFANIFYSYRMPGKQITTTDLYLAWNKFVEYLTDLKMLDDSNSAIENEAYGIFESVLNAGALKYADINHMYTYIDQLKNGIVSGKGSLFAYRMESLFSRIIMALAKGLNTKLGENKNEAKNESEAFRKFILNSYDVINGSDLSYESVMNGFAALGFDNAYLYVFEEARFNLQGDPFNPGETLLLKSYVKEGIARGVDRDKQEVPIEDVFDNDYMSVSAHNYIAMPLYKRELVYGILVCDAREGIFDSCEFMSEYLGATVMQIDTLKSNGIL